MNASDLTLIKDYGTFNYFLRSTGISLEIFQTYSSNKVTHNTLNNYKKGEKTNGKRVLNS